MKIRMLLFLCLVSIGLSAQEKGDCYIDAKTGDTVRNTKWYNLENASTYLISFRFVRINSAFTLELKYHFGEGGNFTIKKGDSLWIKFDNGASITLFSNDSAKSRKGAAAFPGAMRGLVTPGVYVRYPITASNMTAMSVLTVEKFRIFSSRGFDNIPVPRSREDVMKVCSRLIIVPESDCQVKEAKEPEIDPEQKAEEW